MPLSIGDKAPDFTLPSTDGTISLSTHKGTYVVLYFYPKDDTPGCTTEACDFRDNMNSLQQQGITILGASKDSLASHEKFKAKFSLNFPLLSDTEGTLCAAYDTWTEKSMYGKKYMGIERATFLIAPDGTLAHIWRNVKVPGHVQDIADTLKRLATQAA